MSFDSLADLPTWVLAIGGLIGLALVFLHVWLSRRPPVWLGGIIPSLYLVASIFFAIVDQPRVGELVGTGITFVALLIIWWVGEDKREALRTQVASP
ncbi:hypothetical protein [Micrococcoides hystricis]|uniref:Integral membrane protein n=1 Tax=Micrococcoides hystricis TaxID=1572761 RepID=A0ABV6PBS9_9MICC